MTTKYLTQAAELLADRGYSQIGSNHDDVDKGSGINYVVFQKNGDRFHVRAKEYVYEGKAPFGTAMIEKAISKHAYLVIWFADVESFFVFRPSYVRSHGELTTGRSKRSESREWREVSLDDGVTLEHFEGGERPRGVTDSADGTINAALSDFT